MGISTWYKSQVQYLYLKKCLFLCELYININICKNMKSYKQNDAKIQVYTYM